MAKPTVQSKETAAAKILQYADNILQKMTENASLFPDPDPGLPTLEAAIADLREALSEALFRDRRMVALKNQRFAALREVIYQLSLYVDQQSRGDEVMILAAGFLPSRKASPRGVPPKPSDFRVNLVRINSQSVALRVKSWRPARVYQFEYRKVSESEDAEWRAVLSSKSSLVLEGLERLQEYEFRVAYIGTDPTVTYSDVVRSYVL